MEEMEEYAMKTTTSSASGTTKTIWGNCELFWKKKSQNILRKISNVRLGSDLDLLG